MVLPPNPHVSPVIEDRALACSQKGAMSISQSRRLPLGRESGQWRAFRAPEFSLETGRRVGGPYCLHRPAVSHPQDKATPAPAAGSRTREITCALLFPRVVDTHWVRWGQNPLQPQRSLPLLPWSRPAVPPPAPGGARPPGGAAAPRVPARPPRPRPSPPLPSQGGAGPALRAPASPSPLPSPPDLRPGRPRWSTMTPREILHFA